MENMIEQRRAAFAATWAGLGTAGIFEALTLLATQDKTVWAASPWRDDPFHTVVSLAAFTIPMLSLAIMVRLLAWRSPGGLDRAQQTLRAVCVMTALIMLTVASEWVAVSDKSRLAWTTWTGVLTGGLILNSVLVVAVMLVLLRSRRQDDLAGRWRHDWLGDVVVVCRWIPILRRWARPEAAAWIRRRAMAVFVALSVLAAGVLTAFQALGERWHDPLLIGWMLVVETTSNIAFCVISNALVGFIARPARTRRSQILEDSAVAGFLAILAAVGFHDALWRLFGNGPLNSVPALAALTLGAGLVTFLVAVAVLRTLIKVRPIVLF